MWSGSSVTAGAVGSSAGSVRRYIREEAALGATGGATIATGFGPAVTAPGPLQTHVANREQNAKAVFVRLASRVRDGYPPRVSCVVGGHEQVCAHRVDARVDSAGALDWRAGHRPLCFPMKRT